MPTNTPEQPFPLSDDAWQMIWRMAADHATKHPRGVPETDAPLALWAELGSHGLVQSTSQLFPYGSSYRVLRLTEAGRALAEDSLPAAKDRSFKAVQKRSTADRLSRSAVEALGEYNAASNAFFLGGERAVRDRGAECRALLLRQLHRQGPPYQMDLEVEGWAMRHNFHDGTVARAVDNLTDGGLLYNVIGPGGFMALGLTERGAQCVEDFDGDEQLLLEAEARERLIRASQVSNSEGSWESHPMTSSESGINPSHRALQAQRALMLWLNDAGADTHVRPARFDVYQWSQSQNPPLPHATVTRAVLQLIEDDLVGGTTEVEESPIPLDLWLTRRGKRAVDDFGGDVNAFFVAEDRRNGKQAQANAASTINYNFNVHGGNNQIATGDNAKQKMTLPVAALKQNLIYQVDDLFDEVYRAGVRVSRKELGHARSEAREAVGSDDVRALRKWIGWLRDQAAAIGSAALTAATTNAGQQIVEEAEHLARMIGR